MICTFTTVFVRKEQQTNFIWTLSLWYLLLMISEDWDCQRLNKKHSTYGNPAPTGPLYFTVWRLRSPYRRDSTYALTKEKKLHIDHVRSNSEMSTYYHHFCAHTVHHTHGVTNTKREVAQSYLKEVLFPLSYVSTPPPLIHRNSPSFLSSTRDRGSLFLSEQELHV